LDDRGTFGEEAVIIGTRMGGEEFRKSLAAGGKLNRKEGRHTGRKNTALVYTADTSDQ